MHHLNVFELMAVSVLLIAVKLNYAILLLQFDVSIEPLKNIGLCYVH